MIPVSFVIAILLMSQGVVQTFQATTTVTELESGLKAVIPLGLAASQIAIKQLGTNGEAILELTQRCLLKTQRYSVIL